MQRENRITYKAVDEEGEKRRIVGFVTWTFPKKKVVGSGGEGWNEMKEEARKEKLGLPSLPGVNVDLWMQKMNGTRIFSERDLDPDKDMGELLPPPLLPLTSFHSSPLAKLAC